MTQTHQNYKLTNSKSPLENCFTFTPKDLNELHSTKQIDYQNEFNSNNLDNDTLNESNIDSSSSDLASISIKDSLDYIHKLELKLDSLESNNYYIDMNKYYALKNNHKLDQNTSDKIYKENSLLSFYKKKLKNLGVKMDKIK